MGLYTKDGYIDIDFLRRKNKPFIFITSARGTGKTRGAIMSVLKDDGRFVYMRRTATQADIAGSEKLSPLVTICHDEGIEIAFDTVAKNVTGVLIDGELKGYIMALSTMANIRGFEDPSITAMVYDEFIPLPEERPIRHEGEAFLHAYETLNRNRELYNIPPIQVIGCSNSNNILNPIYTELQIVGKVHAMISAGQEILTIPERGMVLVCPTKSPISERKKGTALYKLSGDSEFTRLSICNEFVRNQHMGIVKSENLKEYIPILNIGEITIYRHKSTDIIYISQHYSGSPVKLHLSDAGLEVFRQKYAYLWLGYCIDKLHFESYICEALFRTYMGKKGG